MKRKFVPKIRAMELASLLGTSPGVVITEKLNSTNFTVKNKVFAFTKRDGVALKLPRLSVNHLIAARAGTALVMGRRTMKEWIVIPLDSNKERFISLLKESRDFVSSNFRA
jgi:hypothetical protein